jgi:hypothetical protein
VAGAPTGIDRALQHVDGLAPVEDAQELATEGIVQESIAQEHVTQ